MSQTELGGEEVSAGYLSRLESGARKPNSRIVAILAQRLGVAPAELGASHEPDLTALLAEFHSSPGAATEYVHSIELALNSDTHADPGTRWQALWALATVSSPHGDGTSSLETLASLVDTARQMRSSVLLTRAEATYSRHLRILGDYDGAKQHAEAAVEAAEADEVGIEDRAQAMQALIAVEGDRGNTPEARRHAEALLALVEDMDGATLTQALWVNATVRMLEGDRVGALDMLGQAVESAKARDGITLWLRVRLASASLHLQMVPPDAETVRESLSQISPFIELLGEPRHVQEFHAIEAHLALAEHDVQGARRRARELLADEHSLLSHRDRVRLRTIEGRAAIIEGDVAGGVRLLRDLADEVGAGALATEIYRLVVETLDNAQQSE